MKKLILLLIFQLISNTLSKCVVKNARADLSRSINQFSTKLLPKIAADQENHFVVSIPSIWTLLASISLGATDTTHVELNQVLGWRNMKCFKKINLNPSTTDEFNNSTGVVVERASNIYVDRELTILKKFQKAVQDLGLSNFENISFEDPDSAAKIVNDFVKKTTHDNIKQIVSPSDLGDVLMIMLDVVYFEGAWRDTFPRENTQIDSFYDDKETEIGQVNLMSVLSTFKVLYVKALNANVIELPYGNNTKYSMLIFLPSYDGSLQFVIENFKNISLFKIGDMLKDTTEGEYIIQMPRFEMSSNLRNLKTLLASIGLKSPFDSSTASFKSISHQDLYVSNFIQKANIKVTEEGTVASAATEAEMGFRSLPSEFIVNKPFMYMIYDKKLKIPLFTGAYSRPSLF